MSKYKRGDVVRWPEHPVGFRMILGVDEGRSEYRTTDFYPEDDEPYHGDQVHILNVEFVDKHYHAVGAGGDEKAAPDTAEVERLSAEVTNLTARLAASSELCRKQSNDVDRIGELLIEEAESRDWCSDYDRWVNDTNSRLSVFELPTRAKDYDVALTYTVTIYATVNACDASSAVDEAYEAFDEPGEVRYHSASWDFQSGDAEES